MNYTRLRIAELAPGASETFETAGDELIVLPLSGACSVEIDGERHDLEGRESVFSAVTDFAYAPRDARVELHSEVGGRFALPAAAARRRLAPRYCPAEDVPVELRGAGNASRQVNNFCAEHFPADALLAVEVLTPDGNWSSYPPHKHDEDVPGVEVALEEIYYFEVVRRRLRLSARVRRHGRALRGPHRRPHRHAVRLPRPVAWRRPATTSTTSTSWPAPASAPGASPTTPRTPGSAAPGPIRRSIRGCP